MSNFRKNFSQIQENEAVDLAESPKRPGSYNVFEEIQRQVSQTRAQVGMTQTELANKAGLTQANISRIEKGLSHPTVETLLKIATGMGKRLTVRLEDLDEEVEL
jgi:DNA-binding XRE family transcriptional regulator